MGFLPGVFDQSQVFRDCTSLEDDDDDDKEDVQPDSNEDFPVGKPSQC